jgi:outer membrane protein TolC
MTVIRNTAVLGLMLCWGAFGQTENPITLTLPQALERARQYAQQVYQASFAAQIAREDTVQAKAALLPTLTGLSQFFYTQPNGSDTGVFIGSNSPRQYTNWAQMHAEIYNPARIADWRRTIAAEAVAHARFDLANRGVIGTVVQDYYGMLSAQRKIATAQQSLQEAQTLLDITQKQEAGGEVSHYDVVKAQILVEQRLRDVQEAQLAFDKARIGFAVLLFPDLSHNFTLADDMESIQTLPSFPEIEAMLSRNSPDLRVAEATVEQQRFGVASARAALYPSLSTDYFFGMQAPNFAVHNNEGMNNLGSAVQVQVNLPVLSWGATRSKVRQAQFQLEQARRDLSFTQKTVISELNQFYLEGQVASAQIASLRRSLALSEDGLRLIMLRYQAGEATILEVSDAQSTAVQARNAFIDGLARYRIAIGALQTLTGVF